MGGYLNWRFAFWIEAILMLPFAILGFVMKPLQLKGSFRDGSCVINGFCFCLICYVRISYAKCHVDAHLYVM